MDFLKKHWPSLSLLAGFLLAEVIIYLVAITGTNATLPENMDLIEAIKGALGSLIWILVLYLCALVCAALALRFSLKKVEQEKDVVATMIAGFSALALCSTVVQAIVVVWQNLAWITDLPGLFG